MSIFDRTIGRIAGVALDAIETVFSRGSLRDHPTSARVIVCLPNTIDRYGQAQPSATLDTLNANLGRVGHCSEVVTSPDLEKYHVYGPNLQELRKVTSHICIDILDRSDAHLLCTPVDRSVVDEQQSLDPPTLPDS